jgi:hypothetical protein
VGWESWGVNFIKNQIHIWQKAISDYKKQKVIVLVYLHRQGCDYFVARFKNFELTMQQVLEKLKGQGMVTVEKMIQQSAIQQRAFSPRDDLETLNEHIENIEKHIQSDENVLRTHLNRINQAMFNANNGKISPQNKQLFTVVSAADELDSGFKNLKSSVSSAIVLLTTRQNTAAADLLSLLSRISNELYDIRNKSHNLVSSINKLVIELQAQELMIRNDKKAVTDFAENLKSWA